MSTITFGPPVVLDGPLPSPPPYSLLNVPGVLQEQGDDRLQESVRQALEGDRWTNGVALWGFPDGLPETWDPCGSGTFATKSDASSWETPDFAAFTAYIPVQCSSFSLARDPAGFGRRAEIALDARISYAVEAALSKGVPMLANPYLADSNPNREILAAGAAVSPNVGLAYLEEAIGQTAIVGMIHTPPGPASRWFSNRASPPEDEPKRALFTSLGTPVAVGGGYAGAQPSGEAAPGDGEAWVFATGPVRAYVADEPQFNIKEVLDRADNDVVFRAEKYTLVEWDTSLQAAVLIDWTMS
jgi:hypothetical protein